MFYNINRIFVAVAGIYIHIPFCKTRCVYCDFFSSVSMKSRAAYVNALCKELELRRDYLGGQAIETIYFGGGTPSQLPAVELQQVLDAAFSIYPVAAPSGREITIEANPDDMTPEYMGSLAKLAFNRISIGIQSFHDKDLKRLNRRHSAEQALRAVGLAKEAGFENISIDLMYGLPGQTLAEWQENLRIARELGVQHISAYHLIYEEGTPLYGLLQKKEVEECDEELSTVLFAEMIDRLAEAGFVHYEISNFALPGRIARHNSSYWTGERYMGVGASAHSYDGSSRQWNVDSIDRYINEIEQGIVPATVEVIDLRTAYNDYIITRLRTAWGIDPDEVERRFGSDNRHYCERQSQRHFLNGTLIKEGGAIKLSRKGIFLSDGIMSDLMLAP